MGFEFFRRKKILAPQVSLDDTLIPTVTSDQITHLEPDITAEMEEFSQRNATRSVLVEKKVIAGISEGNFNQFKLTVEAFRNLPECIRPVHEAFEGLEGHLKQRNPDIDNIVDLQRYRASVSKIKGELEQTGMEAENDHSIVAAWFSRAGDTEKRNPLERSKMVLAIPYEASQSVTAVASQNVMDLRDQRSLTSQISTDLTNSLTEDIVEVEMVIVKPPVLDSNQFAITQPERPANVIDLPQKAIEEPTIPFDFDAYLKKAS